MKQKLQAWWQGLSLRERRAIGVMAIVVALVLLWQAGIAMPLSSLRETARQQQQAQAEWDQVQTLRAQALALRARSTNTNAPTAAISSEAILQTLQTATAASGDTRAQVNETAPGNYNVRFDNVSPEALATWLQTVRQQAHLLPQNADLQRVNGNLGTWRGSITLVGN